MRRQGHSSLFCSHSSLVEVLWSGFRDSFSKEYPFVVGIISSIIFVALGAVVVDIYLDRRKEQQAEHEREEELRACSHMGLWKAEVEKSGFDRERSAKSIEDALSPLRTS